MQDRAIVTIEGELETAPKLSNGTSLNDLEWPLTQISRSLFNVEQLENGTTRQSYIYNGGQKSRIWSIKRRHF